MAYDESERLKRRLVLLGGSENIGKEDISKKVSIL